MASLFAQASRARATLSAARACLVSRRYLLATAGLPHRDTQQADIPSPQQDTLPHFLTLKGSVSADTLKAITSKPMNLTHMSPVQAAVFPLLPQLAEPYITDAPPDSPPRDLLVRAKTGTGKTLGFLLPAVEARLKSIEAHGKAAVKDAGLVSDKNLEARARKAFAHQNVGTLIISPTRELATQIANEALKLTHHVEGFEVRLFVGGSSKRGQMRDWMRGRRDIVVSTPGRLRDFLNSEPEVARGISKTQLLILDEADTLLDMGFRDDIEAIKEALPPVPERQTFLFSATVSRSIQQIARSTLAPNHKFINCVTENSSPVHAHVEQYHTVLPSASHQIPHVLRLLAHDQLSNPGHSKVIVFLPTTKMTQLFATALRELSKTTLPAGRNARVYEIHSKRTMDARISTSESFRTDKSGVSVLVTSDVSARGVDYPGVTRVIQVGIPGGTEQYIHRVGRTGRAGTQGRGDLVLLPWEIGFVTWQLTQVPLQPLTTQELAAQTLDLAKLFDENPTGFFADAPTPLPVSRGPRYLPVSGPAMFKGPVLGTMEDVERNVTEFLARLDEEAIRETFMSLLGYYVSKTPELRTQKGVIVEGCRAWTVDACGLHTPPYVSERFLQQIGLSDGRTKNFGKPQRGYGRGPSENSWLGRGRQEYKGREKETSTWIKNDRDPSASEYRGSRYGREDVPAPVEEGGYHAGRRDGSSQGGYGGGGRDSGREGGYSSRTGGEYGGRRPGGSRGGYGGGKERNGGFEYGRGRW